MIDLLKQLIQAAPNEQNGEAGAARILENYFKPLNLDCQVETWDTNRANFTVILKGKARRPGLMFAAHLDVVPADSAKWSVPCHDGLEKDGGIWGRGSVDMLGGLTAAAAAIAEISRSGQELAGDVILTATAGEETDSCGARRFEQTYQEKLGPLAGVILPEPTDMQILTAHRGILWAQIQTHGKNAHGSMPHLGINAIHKMTPILNRLADFKIPHTPHPELGGCSMSLNQIHGGTATNIVPDACRIELDIRTVPGQSADQILADLQNILDEVKKTDLDFSADITVLRSVGPMQTDPQSPFVQQLLKASGIAKTNVAPFTTDGPHFLPFSRDIVVFGPGQPALCHKPDEHIQIAELQKAKETYKQIMLHFLANE